MIDIYDFDKTIYDGDSTIDFYLYCMRKKPSLLGYLPFQFWHTLCFALGLEERTTFKSNFLVFLRSLPNVDQLVHDFWDKNERKIKQWYRVRDHSSDVIISASPQFLLSPIARKLQVHKLIATRVDIRSGSIEGLNCRGQEKVTRLKSEISELKIGRAYTDSLSDMPLLALAREGYIVKGHVTIRFEKYLKLSKIRRIFLS